MRVLLFDGRTDGLPAGTGLVIIGHGADDSLLDPVNVLNTGACPSPFLPQPANFAEPAIAKLSCGAIVQISRVHEKASHPCRSGVEEVGTVGQKLVLIFFTDLGIPGLWLLCSRYEQT